MSKYKSTLVPAGLNACGYSHRSKLEASVCAILRQREKAGEIKVLAHESHVLISGWYLYIADFKCLDLEADEEFWVESKSEALLHTGRWPSTRKGWRHCGPGKLYIYVGDYRRPYLKEVLVPQSKT